MTQKEKRRLWEAEEDPAKQRREDKGTDKAGTAAELMEQEDGGA